jgi:A118 family predicted phage portal protein
MPNIIREQLLRKGNIDYFYNPTYYYRQLALCVYEGYVPVTALAKWDAYPGLIKYKSFHEYTDKSGITRYRKTIGLPKTISEYLVKNTFAEFPEIETGQATKDIIEILNNNHFLIVEKDEFETQINLGGRAIKPYLENEKIKIANIDGTRFFVTHVENKKVIGGVFVSTKTMYNADNEAEYYTRLEWHYPEEKNGKVKRIVRIEAFKSNKGKGYLNYGCSLSDLSDVFGDSFAEDIEDSIEEFDIPVPTFVYIKNPIKNNKDIYSAEGLGAMVNSLDNLMSLDEGYNGNSTENRRGTMKTYIPEGATEENIDENAKPYKHFDETTEEIYVYSGNAMSEYKIQVEAPTLRTEQFIASINMDIDIISSNVGITPGTLRFDGKSVVTATQVITEKSDTARTIKVYEQNIEDGWKDLFMLIQYLVNDVSTGSMPKFKREDIVITWKDNVIIDDETHKENIKYLSTEDMIPDWYVIMEMLGVTKEEAIKLSNQAEEEKEKRNVFILGDNDDDDGDNNPNPDDDREEEDEE